MAKKGEMIIRTDAVGVWAIWRRPDGSEQPITCCAPDTAPANVLLYEAGFKVEKDAEHIR